MSLVECLQPYLDSVPVHKEIEYELNIAPVPDDIETRLQSLGFVFPVTTYVFDRVYKERKTKFRVRHTYEEGARAKTQLTVKRRLPHESFKSAEEQHFALCRPQLRSLLFDLNKRFQIPVTQKYRVRRTWQLPDTHLHVHVDTYADGFRSGEFDCEDERFLEEWLVESQLDIPITTNRTSKLRKIWQAAQRFPSLAQVISLST